MERLSPFRLIHMRRRRGACFPRSPRRICLPHSTREILIFCWQAFLKQAERDENVRTLLLTIRDAFDFAQLEDVLKSIKAGSKQAEILTGMLKEVQACSEFIKRYADDPQLCTSPPPVFCRRLQICKFAAKRTLKNIAGQADPRIQQHRDTLAGLKEAFLAHAIIIIQYNVRKLRDAGA